MIKKTFNYNGDAQKISKYIISELPFLNYIAIQKLLRKGDIRINEKKIYSDSIVKDSDTVTVFYIDETEYTPDTVYEDDNIVVYNKPKKIASDGEFSFETKIKNFVNPGYILCHRLDTNTDGLIIFAKNNDVYELIKEAFKNHEIKKLYLACVYGDITQSAELKDYLVKDSAQSLVKIYPTEVENSEQIITRIRPVKNCGTHTYIEVELVTGKTHQIRAHLASIGNYVIGDGKYGKEEINNSFKSHLQALTSYKLEFNFTDKKLAYLNSKIIELKISDKFFKY